jgi:hypothetical protein
MAMALAFVLGQRGFRRLLCSMASVLAGSELKTASWAAHADALCTQNLCAQRASNDHGCRVPRAAQLHAPGLWGTLAPCYVKIIFKKGDLVLINPMVIIVTTFIDLVL